MVDTFQRFSEFYINGNIRELIKSALPHPDATYDNLHSEHQSFQPLLNYIDATLFGTLLEAFQANLLLQQYLVFEPTDPYIGQLLTWLDCDNDFLAATLKDKSQAILSPFQRQLIDSAATMKIIDTPSSCAPHYQEWFESQQSMLKGWIIAHQHRPEYMAQYNSQDALYPLPCFCLNRENVFAKQITFTNEPALWIFDHWNHFLQSLQFPELHQILSNPKNAIFILDLYPNQQLKFYQNCRSLPKIFLSPHATIQNAIPFLTDKLDRAIEQPMDSLHSDTEIADILYCASKHLNYSVSQNRLGKSRAPALFQTSNINRWFDPHKGKVDKKLLPELSSPDLFSEVLDQLKDKRHAVKNHSKNKPLKLTHVTAQIIDDQHAPSRLLETLILLRNPKEFQVDVIVTEQLLNRPVEYPTLRYISLPTTQRGEKRIERFIENGVPVKVHAGKSTYLSESENLIALLEKNGSDIVIFHGPDALNMMTAQMTSAPLRVLFEHGTATSYPGFDLMIASSLDAERIYGAELKKIGTAVEPLPFHVDVRKKWPKDPPTLKDLDLPENALVMTTISGHLADRLGSKMCKTIATILKKVPNAFYAPIGTISAADKEVLLSHFKEQGVDNRVKFLGMCEDPGYISQCMKIYLNEFPFGSCLGMLDAMAAGCAVVSMHDPQGPSQARYGADFLGIERTIPKGDVDGYINLACKLLTDPVFFQEWSAHSLNQYKKHSNEQEYVNNFEKIISKHYFV